MTVAPFTGAWIEIVIYLARRGSPGRSHPSRVRGLKYGQRRQNPVDGPVAPFTGAWIEMMGRASTSARKSRSHPSRVRGLKSHRLGLCQIRQGPSHPSRVRGLKFG